MAIAQLSVDLIANLAKFDQGMRAAVESSDTAAKKISASFDQVTGGLKKVAIAVTGISSLAALDSIISSAIEAKAKLYDLSLQTGIAVEQLSALGKVGKLSNTGLEDIAAASNKLNKALATSNEDSRGAATAIKALGLDFQTLKAQSPDQQLLTIAKALDKYANDGKDAVAAQLLFGKTGAQLLPFLKELAQTQQLVGSQTTESAKQAKEYEDNLVRLKGASEAWKRVLAEALLPSMVDVTSELVEFSKKGGSAQLVADGIKVTFQTLAVVGAAVQTVFLGVGREIGAVAAQLRIVGEAAMEGLQNNIGGGLTGFAIGFSAAWAKRLDEIEAISDEVKADGEKQAQKEKEFVDRVMNIGARAPIATAADFQRGDKDTSAVRKPSLNISVPDKDSVKDQENAIRSAIKAYNDLIAKIGEKSQTEQLEIDTGQKLTDGQKYALDVVTKIAGVEAELRNRGIELTKAQRERFDALKITTTAALEQYIVLQRLSQQEQDFIRRRSEESKAIAQQLQAYDDANRALAEQRQEIGLTANEVEALRILRLQDIAARRQEALEQKVGFGLSADTAKQEQLLIDALRDQIALRQSINDAQRAQREDPAKGLTAAAQDYLETARNVGAATKSLASGALSTLENDLTSGLAKGKVNLQSFVDFALQEFYRLLVVRPALAQLSQQLENLGRSAQSSNGGFLGAVLDMVGLGSGYNGSTGGINGGSTVLPNSLRGGAAGGTNLLDRDMITLLHKGEAVVPKQYNPAAGGGASPQFRVIINNDAKDIVQASARQSSNDPQALEVQVRRLVRDENARDLRSGAGPISNGLKGRGVVLDSALPKRG